MSTWEVIYCPACDAEVFRHSTAQPDTFRASVPRKMEGKAPDILTAMMMASEQAHRERIEKVERACTEHFREKHRYRYWVWKRLGWKSAITKRLRRKPVIITPIDTQTFDLKDFLRSDAPGVELEIRDA